MAAGKVMSLRAKMRFLRRNGRQGEVLSGENESYTEYPLLKVRTLREKVRFIRRKRVTSKPNRLHSSEMQKGGRWDSALVMMFKSEVVT